MLRDFNLSHLADVLTDTNANEYPNAASIEQGVVVYDAQTLSGSIDVAAELYTALSAGPGIVVVKGMMPDHSVLDRASEVFSAIIDAEKEVGQGAGDHFAKPGANDRVWNSFEKHCLADPANFARYFTNHALDTICKAWLGPAYQMTAQVNRVNPGGAAQTAHRDYHLGFMSEEQMRAYPPSVHQLSPMLTLQGAIAHVDMPIEAGPTMYLPHSQKWPEGFLYYSRDEVQALFAERMVQLPLAKGDGAFFNPALLHGAGNNISSDIYRMGNLLQISSAMGRPMETVDRPAMTTALMPIFESGAMTGSDRKLLVEMVAQGYPFPTSLDTDPPVGGLAPKSQAQKLLDQMG